MTTRWQIGAVSTLSVGFLLAIVLTLSGMSNSHDGDKFCTDCYSEIKVNSTYWNVCVEHAENKTAIFKKSVYGRTLWINLDAIDEVISTDPKVHVDLMVPTTKARAEVTNEYGYLRNVKDGDCIIGRGENRIILHGQKEAWQTVKWSFNIEHWQSEDINIDPVWKGNGIEAIQECKTKTEESLSYYSSTYEYYENKTTCIDAPINKTCSKTTVSKYNITLPKEYINYINTTTCKDAAISIKGKIINFTKYNWKGYEIIGENVCFEAQHLSNGNNKCESGEGYEIYDNNAKLISPSVSDKQKIEALKVE